MRPRKLKYFEGTTIPEKQRLLFSRTGEVYEQSLCKQKVFGYFETP